MIAQVAIRQAPIKPARSQCKRSQGGCQRGWDVIKVASGGD